MATVLPLAARSAMCAMVSLSRADVAVDCLVVAGESFPFDFYFLPVINPLLFLALILII